MLPPPMIRDWARRLIASEFAADPLSAQTEHATIRVYEKLRQYLCTPVGVSGFQALASRALSLAKSQCPKLCSVQVTANGGLRGLGEAQFQLDTDENGGVGIDLISQLLGLLFTLIGEAATMRLMEDVHCQTMVGAELEMTEARIAARGMRYLEPFEDILLEADQLRSVSERLETLADRHTCIEEIMSLAGNIRKMAALLDIFTLIRSKAGDDQDEARMPPANGYVN